MTLATMASDDDERRESERACMMRKPQADTNLAWFERFHQATFGSSVRYTPEPYRRPWAV